MGIFLNHCTVKFKFDFINDKSLNDFFDNAGYLLNYQFDDESNIVFIDASVDYQIEDVSNLNSEDIGSITNSFFNFEFKNTFNVFLYKFLVLKNKDKFTLLANIHPSIFNYASINDFYELFNNVNSAPNENQLCLYYDDVKNYLNSSDYDNDLDYWRNISLTASDVQAIPISAKGAANGVCPLNANSIIDSQYLPSFVDDVVEAYPRTGQTELSSTWLATGSADGTVITPQTGVIYLLMADSETSATNTQFRWGGTSYVKLNDGGVSSITQAEINQICV